MDTSELWVIYSPHYEDTNTLIKWRFRLIRMVYRACVQERMYIGRVIKLTLAES